MIPLLAMRTWRDHHTKAQARAALTDEAGLKRVLRRLQRDRFEKAYGEIRRYRPWRDDCIIPKQCANVGVPIVFCGGPFHDTYPPTFQMETRPMRLTGKNLYIEFQGVALDANQRSLEINEEQEMVDATAGADSYRVMLPTVKTIGATVEILQETYASGSAVLDALRPGAAGTLVWGPEGSASGLPKWGFSARVQTADRVHNFDDVATISVEFANTGTDLVFDGGTDTF